jgi:6-hydroxycyclohex-1-ene-1-carbonyl-CoA dehydrogenase
MNLLTHGGVLMVVGYHGGDVSVRLSNLMAFAARAEGVWGCDPGLYPEVLDLVLSGKLDLASFTELFPMSEINVVIEKVHRHELTKRPVLVPDAAMMEDPR